MDYKIFNLKIDLGRESRNAVKPVQGESAVKLRATLTHNSQPYNLTDTTVRCLFRKPDHTYSYIDAVVIDAAKGIVEIELTNQVLLLSGSVVAAIEVAGTIGIAKTWLFTMDVQPGIPYTDIESVDEFPAVEQMIIDIAEIKANFNAIVAGVTVDGEVILARAGFTTLGERIDDLATKVNTTLPAQLAEKVQGFKIKNEVVNGDFSQGTSNITDVTGGTLSLVDGRPRNTGNGVLNRQQLGVNISPTVIGRKYYYRLIVKCSGNPTSFRFHIGTVLQINGSLVANVETIKSEVITATGTTSSAYAYVNYADNITQSGKTLDIDNLVIVDLTNLFGAGNEPSKVQMDELMKVIPNQWWGGELTLTQKQFITWQLNLIRKNTNAIIALGGTIV